MGVRLKCRNEYIHLLFLMYGDKDRPMIEVMWEGYDKERIWP
jgi:hypothetical protein